MTELWQVREYVLTHHTSETTVEMVEGLRKLGINVLKGTLNAVSRRLGAYPVTRGDQIRNYMRENPNETIPSLMQKFRITRSAVSNHKTEIKKGTRTGIQALTDQQIEARKIHESERDGMNNKQAFVRPKAVYSQKSSPLVNEARGIVTTH